jgi:uncharacterized repeat protein (TIGR01451 family)
MQNQNTNSPTIRTRLKRITTTAFSFAIVLEQAAPAFAAIDNTASATGSYGASTVNSNNSGVSVPVTGAAAGLSIVKSVTGGPTVGNGADITIADAGDTITFQYVVTNTGNVTMTNVTPVDVQPQFNGTNGTNSFGAFTPVASLAPNASATFSATYTMSQLDVLRAAGIVNGVGNVATATGLTPAAVLYTSPTSNTATATVPAGTALLVAKSSDAAVSLLPSGTADVGDVVTYTYTVTNTGNVPLTDVTMADTHEGGAVALGAGGITADTLASEGPLGTSTDATVNDGIWSLMQPGASVTFTYAHTVTQTEVDGG